MKTLTEQFNDIHRKLVLHELDQENVIEALLKAVKERDNYVIGENKKAFTQNGYMVTSYINLEKKDQRKRAQESL